MWFFNKEKILFFVVVLLVLISCKKNTSTIFYTNQNDYLPYLNTQKQASTYEAFVLRNFWSKRLKVDTSGVGDIGPLASAYQQLFVATTKVEYLLSAEKLYKKGMQLSANNKDFFARGLAHNYISQHRFTEAYKLLKQVYKEESNAHQTRLMLFDAAMEVADYSNAYKYLSKIKNESDFHYLIRASKWNDHKGDLAGAIQLMEKAKRIAESRASKSLKIWAYSNLGDYYGHAGRISEAYSMYLKTLELQPDHIYAKKAIAWILFSAEYDTKGAHQILDSVFKSHRPPDYYLLKADLYEYDNHVQKATQLRAQFVKEAQLKMYGAMYTASLIEILSETNPEKAIAIAEKELENRKTPQGYHLLAISQLRSGKKRAALHTIETYVSEKTFDPIAWYHSALVYKANGKQEEVQLIKEILTKASFELGPLLSKKTKEL